MDAKQFSDKLASTGLSIKEMHEATGLAVMTIYKYEKEGVPRNKTFIIEAVFDKLLNNKKSQSEILLENFNQHIISVFEDTYNSYLHKIDYIYDYLSIERENDLIELSKILEERKVKKKA